MSWMSWLISGLQDFSDFFIVYFVKGETKESVSLVR